MPRICEFEYEEKEKEGKPDKVIATVKGSESSYITKIGNKLFESITIVEQESAKIDSWKEELRPYIGEKIFDTKDETLTRVVETKKIIVTLGKIETKTTFDKNKFMAKIAKEFPKLVDKFDEIYKECETSKAVAAKLSIKVKTESFSNTIKTFFAKMKNEVDKVIKNVKIFLSGYDKNLKSWQLELQKNTEQTVQPEEVKDERLELFKKYINEANKWL
jgi:hypothetical protein